MDTRKLDTALGALAVVAALLSDYCDAENECWSALQGLSNQLEQHLGEVCKQLALVHADGPLPSRIGPLGD